MKVSLILLLFYSKLMEAVNGNCKKLTDKCAKTEDCCLGTCVMGSCNDGLYKNMKDRNTGSAQTRAAVIAAELASGHKVDVREHKNAHLLPSWEECGDSVRHKRRRKRIVGGTPYELGKYPWAAQLHFNNITSGAASFHCGASLISKRWVITAGHCITRIGTEFMLKWVTLGSVDMRNKLECDDPSKNKNCSEKSYVDAEIDYWVVHEGYSESHVRHDIGLIRLKKEVNYTDYIRPICLPKSERMFRNWPNGELTVIGWGSQNNPHDTGPLKASVLAQEVDMQLVHRSNCDRYYTMVIGRLRRSQICAGGYHGRGDCGGDSGGSFFKKLPADTGESWEVAEERYFLFGLVSTGASTVCSREGKPSVFTSIMYYMPWIMDHLVPKGKVIGTTRIIAKPVEEFATGTSPPVDVASHPNINLLPKFPQCGLADPKPGPKRVKRIVGGIAQGVGFMPWMAQIYVRHVESTRLTLRCGGVLISSRHVLTGAHCVSDIRGPFVLDSVVLGNFNRKETRECIGDECNERQMSPIEEVISHAAFTKFARENDIALVKLAHDVQFNRFIQPICLPTNEELVSSAWAKGPKDTFYTAAGWGRVTPEESDENHMSNLLVSAKLSLETKAFCEESLTRKIGKLENSRICGGGTTVGRGECVGDTGGPMMRAVNMTGPDGKFYNRMFSFGVLSIVECAHQGVPSVYQNILFYMQWIMDHLDD